MKIILATFNARYTHSSLGLRYLYANMHELQANTQILEFVINTQVVDAVASIMECGPDVVGLGAYIWNANEISEAVTIIKQISPQTIVVLGGPEASYLPHRVDFSVADFIIKGEGDIAFYELCKSIQNGKKPSQKFIQAPLVDINAIELPYTYYSDHDVAHRYIYVEASRGCPFTCEFCLSSLDKKVRNVDLQNFLNALQNLWDRGVRNFKFIDRTFNQGIERANRLMDFFLAKEPPYFIHFEVIPDNFPASLKERIIQFPPACLQLEVGVQTLHASIAENINRKLNIPKIKDNLTFLQTQTNAHLHVDLIVGLPGESLEQFGANLDMLYAMCKSEIQIGILKKLSGTTLNRHDTQEGMVYSHKPPYEILQNNLISFAQMQEIKRFARFWDMLYNSGNFQKSVTYLFIDGKVYAGFLAFSNWLYTQTLSTWQISLDRLALLLFTYLDAVLHVACEKLKADMIEDLMVVRGRKLPNFLRYDEVFESKNDAIKVKFNKRQQKHAHNKCSLV
ncbi:MAG: DUF4080 domain-containing protein [Sulfurospirillum sp.]|nr:DUF4080 domain-containing protein [Sulfurospirillum sp.]